MYINRINSLETLFIQQTLGKNTTISNNNNNNHHSDLLFSVHSCLYIFFFSIHVLFLLLLFFVKCFCNCLYCFIYFVVVQNNDSTFFFFLQAIIVFGFVPILIKLLLFSRRFVYLCMGECVWGCVDVRDS